MDKSRALVLSGGGMIMSAWEIGMIMGLYEGGVDVTDADLVVGTSAGARVGVQITSGRSIADVYASQLEPMEGAKEAVAPPDLTPLRRMFAEAATAPNPQMARARMGAAALSMHTISEADREKMIADELPIRAWPERRLVLNTVDAQTGDWVTFDRHSGIPLVLAVAASCAVPVIYPPATFNGHRYIDGGISSGTNADVARGYDRVLILMARTGALPMLDGTRDPIHRLTLSEEMAILEKAGATVLVVSPDETSAAAMGPHPLDISRRAASAQAGRTQGRALAAQVERLWRS